MKNMPAAGFVIVDIDRCPETAKILDIKYLVLETNEGDYDIPKGQIDKGETSLEAAYRELYEEACIKPKDIILTWGLVHNEITKDLNVYIAEIKKSSLKNVKIGTNPVSLIKEHKKFHWKSVQLAESNLLFYMKGLFNWSESIIL